MNNKYLGCLIGAASGDAIGSVTEMRTRLQILEKFGYVSTFMQAPDDTFARGSEIGRVTDDFSIAHDTVQIILKHQGRIDFDVAKEALLYWGRDDNFYLKFAGPTTKIAVRKLLGEDVPDSHGFKLCNDNGKATNGAAMKTSPIALFSHGNIDKAIQDACTISVVSHNNDISISGAGAIAAATACALQDNVTLEDIVKAGIYGAKEGERLGRIQGDTLAGPSVRRRIELAVELAKQDKSLEEIMDDISDIVGTGLAAAEAVPAVFGIIVACKGDPIKSILTGVNIGNDTDTIATMVGGILGAYHGSDAFPKEYLELINRVNHYQLDEMAKQIEALR
jgi:ADP-ribosylglycohydrolase